MELHANRDLSSCANFTLVTENRENQVLNVILTLELITLDLELVFLELWLL